MPLSKEKRILWNTLKYSYDPRWEINGEAELLEAIVISQRLDRVIEPLGDYIIKVTYNCLSRDHGLTNVHNTNDIIGHAIMQSMVSILQFNPKLGKNPYAYLVTIITGAFTNAMHREKKQHDIKEDMKERLESEG